jgi:hypothetical protein
LCKPKIELKKVMIIVFRKLPGKGTPVTAEFVGTHMVKPLRAWFRCPPPPLWGEQQGEGVKGRAIFP